MLTQWNIFSLLKQFCDIPEKDEESVLKLCEFALNNVLSRVKEDVRKDDERLAYASCALALYTYVLRSTDGVVSFQAGDIRVGNSFKEKLDYAKKLKDDAFCDAAPLFKDEGFYAGSVNI